jgi:hypothetical protein
MRLDTLIEQVRYNCDISDARFAGHYSICGLALRLRDLFKWEHRLAPWEERDAAEVLEWIGRKEQRWEQLQDEDLVAIAIDGAAYEPFDTIGINACLAQRGLYYGAGYAQSLKPSFVLGHVDAGTKHDGLSIMHLGDELARDLLTLPALCQGESIVLRKEAARLFVWDQIFYITPSRRPFLAYALLHAGIKDADPAGLQMHFGPLLEGLYDIFIRHEIGERSDTFFDADVWRTMIAAYAHTPVELLVRAVKDALADTGPEGPLRPIIDQHQAAALGFYLVFHDGLGKQLFPEMRVAFAEFESSGQWGIMDAAVHAIHRKAGSHAARLLDLHAQGQSRGDLRWAGERIRQEFLAPVDSTSGSM